MAAYCLAKADEADRLAAIVSYTRDKARLHEQAKSWREEAQALTAASSDIAPPARRGFRWFRRRPA